MLGFCVAIVAVVTFVLARLFGGSLVPRSVPVLAAFLALVLAVVCRYVARLVEDRHLRPPDDQSEPIVVFGAGDAGNQITRTLLRSPNSPYRPVALVDDDPRLARMQLNGLRVRGTGADALDVATRYGAGSVLVAIPSITGEQLRVFAAPLLDAGLQVLVLPPVAELLGHVRPSDIRPITVADLLGRHPAEVDTAAIAGYVTGRRVLVTGRRRLDRRRAVPPAALLPPERTRDARPRRVRSPRHPAGARGSGPARLTVARPRRHPRSRAHLPGLPAAPPGGRVPRRRAEAPAAARVQPVRGVEDQRRRHPSRARGGGGVGVSRLVNVSSDKAADPASVLGYVKRICERLTAEVADRTGLPYVSVRFGNVLGSKGSMLGVFERQIRDGGPITVTHPDVSRYFMTSEEAIALTIQAGAIGRPGEVLVLDMGEPVRIAEVATRLAEQASSTVPIVYTGLRPGEKLHEVLLGAGEVDVRPTHPLISQVPVPPLRFDDARAACSVDGRLVLSVASLEIAAEWGLGGAAERPSSTMMVVDDGDDG